MKLARIKFAGISVASNEFLHLDALRFIASVGIVVDHSSEYFFQESLRPRVHTHVNGLGMFVDMFFVISGFVIAYVYQQRVSSVQEIGNFFQRRVGRLIPLHWLTLFISASLLLFILFGLHKHVNHPPTFRPVILTETFLLLQSILNPNEPAINGVTWSVSAEVAMYALFPLFAWVSRRSKAAIPIGCAIVIVTIMASYKSVWFPNSEWGALYPPLRAFPSFLFGMALFNYRSVAARLMPRFGFLLSTIIFLTSALITVPDMVSLLLAYVVVSYAVAADSRKNSGEITFALAALGQLTYSIYMWHMVIIVFFSTR